MATLHMTPWLVVGALIIGVFIGILTGLFGVGGGFLITPLLNVMLGVPMPVAVGTGALQILGTATAGLFRRRHDGQVDYKMALVLFGGNVVGVRLGDGLVQWLKGLGALNVGGEAVPAVEFVIQLVFVVILAAIAGWLCYDTSRPQKDAEPEGVFSRIRIPPYTEFAVRQRPQQAVPAERGVGLFRADIAAKVPVYRRMSVPVMAYLGLCLGFLTGLLGIGGGVIIVPALLYLVGMSAHRAAATSLAIVWLSSFVAVISKVPQGDTSLALAVPLLLGGTAGLQLGVTICNRTSATRLKRYFAYVVIAAMVVVLGEVITTVV